MNPSKRRLALRLPVWEMAQRGFIPVHAHQYGSRKGVSLGGRQSAFRCRTDAMHRFVGSSEGSNRVGLTQPCQDCINDLWIPAHLDDEQVAAFALDWCRRAVLAEQELLRISPSV